MHGERNVLSSEPLEEQTTDTNIRLLLHKHLKVLVYDGDSKQDTRSRANGT